MIRATWLGLAAALLVGCPPSDTGIGEIVDNPRVNSLFEVNPQLLTFGPLERGSSETGTFTVSNVGNTRIEIRTIGIDGASAFSLVNVDVPVTLEVEESATFTVQYDAANLVDQGNVRVLVDAGGEGAQTVELVGETMIPILEHNASASAMECVVRMTARCVTVAIRSCQSCTGRAGRAPPRARPAGSPWGRR